MADLETPSAETSHRHEDPITHEPGAHPVATGVGAAGGGATGAAVGLLVAGPVGGVIGAVIGALAGGLGGSAVGEAADPTIIDEPAADKVLPRRAATGHESADEYVVAPDGHLERHEIEFPSPVAEPLPSVAHRSTVAVVVAATTISEPSHEEIAVRAWSYYANEGFSDGHDVDHWLRAESGLRTESQAKGPFKSS